MTALDVDNTLAAVNPILWRRFPDSDRGRCHGAPVGPAWFASAEGRRLFAGALPLRGSVKGAWALAAHGRVVYVTTRPVAAAQETWAWLRRHHFPSGPLIFAPRSCDKARWARLFGVRVAVDDAPAAAAAYRAAGIRCLVPRWQYNADDPEAGTWRRLIAFVQSDQ